MLEMNFIQKIAIWALPVLFAITVHEVAHGWVASKFGDQTARLAGRLTLNPIPHIDVVGTLVVPALMLFFGGIIFGWAKPVPVDYRNLRNPKLDGSLVALAGPASNLLMALIWAGVAKIGYLLGAGESWFGLPLLYMGEAGIMINVLLAVLNCLPIPPLDGARVLYNFLPGRWAWYMYRIEPYGFLILLLLIFTRVFDYTLFPIIFFIIRGITFLFGLI